MPGRIAGFAFVQFTTKDAAEKAREHFNSNKFQVCIFLLLSALFLSGEQLFLSIPIPSNLIKSVRCKGKVYEFKWPESTYITNAR